MLRQYNQSHAASLLAQGLALGVASLPDLSADEEAALLGVLAGAQVDAVFLRRLPEALEASAYSAAPSLAAKLRPLGDFERLALALGSARG